jgi:NTE family protein
MTFPDKDGEAAQRDPCVAEKIVNLALQGGGSHGAFAWGVLDRLLELLSSRAV